MIPKVLHRVWLGPNPPGDTYLANWREWCPDWTIRTWGDEALSSVDVPYVKEALTARKWAFASDYLRLLVLYREGGFYLDTDVELTSDFGPCLNDSFCVSLTKNGIPLTAVIGAEPGNALVKELLDGYGCGHFDKGHGVYDERPINLRVRGVFRRRGIRLETMDFNAVHEPMPGVRLYPRCLFAIRLGRFVFACVKCLKGEE